MVVGAVDRLIAESRAEACAAGRKIAAVYEIACAATVAEFAAVEVACALTLSRFAAEGLVELASALCERLPSVLGALSNGDIDVPKARAFTEVLADLDLETARSVASMVLPKAPGRTTGQLREMLRRKALAADPAYAASRRERASARRSVQLHANDDGTAAITAFGLDSARATAAMQRIAALARERRFAGDPGKSEQLRADMFLELLEGKHEGATRGVVNLTVSLETLARLNSNPGFLGNYGPVAADIARQWAEAHPGYRWQYAIIDKSGTLLQTGLTRPPSQSASQKASTPTSPASSGPAAKSPVADTPATGRPAAGRPAADKPAVRGSGADIRAIGRPAAGGPAADKPATGRPAAGRPGADKPAAGRPAADTRARQSPSAAPQRPGIAAGAGVGRRGAGAGETVRGGRAGLARPPVQDPRDRAANAAMTRWIRLRDRTCRAPGCRMPAWQSDIDHNQRYSDGGLTAHDNLCALCRHHHRSKDEGGWALVQSKPGHFIWISPEGRVYEVGPEPP